MSENGEKSTNMKEKNEQIWEKIIEYEIISEKFQYMK